MKKTLYELVGVPRTASREVIAAACQRRIAKLEHDTSEDARLQVFALREAWSVLGDAQQRNAYDASLAAPVAPAPTVLLDPAQAKLAAQMAPETLADTLLKKHEVPPKWNRFRIFAGLGAAVFFIAIANTWNQSRSIAVQKKVEAAEYEQTYGEPLAAKKAAPAPAPEAKEKFSAEQFEKEMREREKELQDQVANDQTAKEDEFRKKLERDNFAGERASNRARRYR